MRSPGPDTDVTDEPHAALARHTGLHDLDRRPERVARRVLSGSSPLELSVAIVLVAAGAVSASSLVSGHESQAARTLVAIAGLAVFVPRAVAYVRERRGRRRIDAFDQVVAVAPERADGTEG